MSVDAWSVVGHHGLVSSRGDLEEVLESVRRAGVCWAGGGAAQPFVDVCVDALVAGLDSPTLRVLAGASRATAEQEVEERAEWLFEELGFEIRERGSLDAVLDWAGQRAQDFLDGSVAERALTTELYRACRGNGFPDELLVWSGLDDWREQLNDSVMQGSEREFVAAVREAAEQLVSLDPGR